MGIENEKLKITCGSCNKDFISTFNTKKCPNCNSEFGPDVIHSIYYEYETKLANSKAYQFGEKAQKFGDNAQKTGNTIQQIGCFIFMLPLGLFCLWFIFKILF